MFESLVGFWYYQAACLIGGSEVPGLSTRPAARYVTMRVFVFYIVVFETNSSRSPPKKLSFPILLPSINQVTGLALLVRPNRPVSSPGLDQKPTRPRLLRSLRSSIHGTSLCHHEQVCGPEFTGYKNPVTN
jgi:hypothetical protein